MLVLAPDRVVQQFPYSLLELKRSGISLPKNPSASMLAEMGVYPVAMTDPPAFNQIAQVAEISDCKWNPDLDHFETVWVIRDLSQQEIDDNIGLLKSQIKDSVQLRLDDFARTREYDGILSACTYATSLVQKFKEEGQYCVQARDATWEKVYQIMAEVEAMTRPAPTGYADIEPLLPALEWPA